MIINVGASAGTVGFSPRDFWSSDGCYCLSHGNQFVPKFLFYYLKAHENSFISKVRRAGIPTLDAKALEDFLIPIIPIQRQLLIVSILDQFERLTVSLTFGIPAEIKARRQQYEYYRDKLLTFKRKDIA